jgi:RNA polymerase sigma-70 factor (ECF subfamily)
VSGHERIDPAAVAALHRAHAEELRYFILAVVRDPELTAEVLQTAFAKVVEVGHTVRQESLKAWLFKVAYNEALAIRRRQAVGERVVRNWASQTVVAEAAADAGASRAEAVAAVRKALDELPADQRKVVWMRMYEHKRFVEIAEELKSPLGTVLSRMQLALKKLRRSLSSHADDPEDLSQ